MSIMSNAGASVQRLFGNTGGKIRQAASKLKSSLSMYDHDVKPYSKMTPAERMAHDADFFEMDPRAVEKHHQKMVKRFGPDYMERFADDMDIEPRGKKGWWYLSENYPVRTDLCDDHIRCRNQVVSIKDEVVVVCKNAMLFRLYTLAYQGFQAGCTVRDIGLSDCLIAEGQLDVIIGAVLRQPGLEHRNFRDGDQTLVSLVSMEVCYNIHVFPLPHMSVIHGMS
ncbi:hypothetical protein D3C76_1026470 [compost metagenome]